MRSSTSCDHRGRRRASNRCRTGLDDLRDMQLRIRLLPFGDTSFSGVFPSKTPSKAKLQGGLCRHFIRVPITYEVWNTVAEGLIKPYKEIRNLCPHRGVILFACHFHIGAEGVVLVGLLVAIIASQLLLQRVVLLLVDEALLVRCPRCSFQAIGRYFAFACEDGIVRALAGDAIVRRSWFYPPDPFDLDAFWQLSPCAPRCCYEHAGGICGGKVEHSDDGFAVEQSIGPDRHDRPGVRVARLACARLLAQAAPLCELPRQKNWGDLPEIGRFSSA